MCDYSLQSVASRPAKVGDKLVTHNFGTGTTGFRAVGEPSSVAVCLLPGTEVVFDERPLRWGQNRYETFVDLDARPPLSKTATFRQINCQHDRVHHDALEFEGDEVVLLTTLREGQFATVLQLPAKPRTKAEGEAQKRVETVG